MSEDRRLDQIEHQLARHAFILEGNGGDGLRTRVTRVENNYVQVSDFENAKGEIDQLRKQRNAIKWILVGVGVANVAGISAIVAALLRVFG